MGRIVPIQLESEYEQNQTNTLIMLSLIVSIQLIYLKHCLPCNTIRNGLTVFLHDLWLILELTVFLLDLSVKE